MEVNVRQQWRTNPALRDSKIAVLKEPVFHQSRFQKAGDEFQETPISNAFCQAVEQDLVMHIVKSSFDVPFHNPVEFVTVVDVAVQGGDTIHGLASRAEAVGAVQEVAFPDR